MRNWYSAKLHASVPTLKDHIGDDSTLAGARIAQPQQRTPRPETMPTTLCGA